MSDSDNPPCVHPDGHMDTTGLTCPEPLMLVRNRVREMQPGEVLLVTATDPSTERDFADFCRFMRHRLLHRWRRDGILCYLIRKG